MKAKSVTVLSVLMLLFCAFSYEVRAEEGAYKAFLRQFREYEAKEKAKKAADDNQSIWDDKSEVNPYFKNKKTNTSKTAEKTNKKQRRLPKKTTFKRRVYTGPSMEEISAAAVKKAVGNFNAFLASEDYEVKYEDIKYNVAGDVLTVEKITFVPVEKNKQDNQKPAIPYLMKADKAVLRNINIGEKSGTPLSTDGEMTVQKLEIPVWNEQGVKKGKVDVARLTITGDIPAYLKGKGEGKLAMLEAKDIRSETIINETILNNVVRSKVFSASDATFKEVELKRPFVDALKRQEVDGITFAFAQVNGETLPTLDGVKAAMLSYSARILNTDLVLGARLEAQKDNPSENPDLELLKKNAADNKAEIEKAAAEELQ